MPGSILGTTVHRVEDPDLLIGRSTFVDNDQTPGVLHAVFVRSSFAHATLTSIEVDEAREAPGVVGVFTAADFAGMSIPPFATLNPKIPRGPLTGDVARYVGDPVALVVADTRAHAVDAAELVFADFDPLPVVADMEGALAEDAPRQFPDLGSNIAASRKSDDIDEDPWAGATHVVRARLENQRLAASPMEPHVILARPAETPDAEHALTVTLGTQHPHQARDIIAGFTGLDPAQVRVIAPHVGGAFGGKAGAITEHCAVVAAARALAAPVKWIETRSEAMISMQSRGQVQYAEMGLDQDGHILGMRLRLIGDAGAYGGFGGGFVLGLTHMMTSGAYAVPRLTYAGVAVLTNTAPTGAFRGAGRPEATALLERLMDIAAQQTGLAPEEIRRRNFISPDRFPFKTITGTTYDIADFDLALREALRVADVDALRADQAQRRRDGDRLQLGIGLSTYIEVTGFGGTEFASVELGEDGRATVRAGTSAHGQGHATSFAMIVADKLGLPMEQIDFVQSDTARVRSGGGTGGSRSLQLGGSAVSGAAEKVLARGRDIAARLLEAGVDDIEPGGDGLAVRGVAQASVGWAEIAAAAALEGTPLAENHDFEAGAATFPFGAHVAVVEVDVETGMVTPLRLVTVDDCGRVLNPLLVQGQQHGGALQGMSQALWEHFEYDAEGTPLTSTFVDYAIPTAADAITFEASNTETPTPLNPLGAKGIGESATIGSTPAVQNAVIDAVSHLGIRHIQLPCTPQRVWQAIQQAEAGTLPDPWHEPPVAFEQIPSDGEGGSVTASAEV